MENNQMILILLLAIIGVLVYQNYMAGSTSSPSNNEHQVTMDYRKYDPEDEHYGKTKLDLF